MLEQIIKSMTPEILVSTIQNNPTLVPSVLQKFEAFVALGQALTPAQQIYISANMSKLSEFFKDKEVKEALGILAEAFVTKTNQRISQPSALQAKV